jgi:hypothetical protein
LLSPNLQTVVPILLPSCPQRPNLNHRPIGFHIYIQPLNLLAFYNTVLNKPFHSNHGPTAATPHTPPQSTPCATDIRLSPLVHYQDPSRDRDKLFTLQTKCRREHTALARWRAVAQDCLPFQQFNLNAASPTPASRPQKELEIGERALRTSEELPAQETRDL